MCHAAERFFRTCVADTLHDLGWRETGKLNEMVECTSSLSKDRMPLTYSLDSSDQDYKQLFVAKMRLSL